MDRTVRDLQAQSDRRERANTQLSEDMSKSRDKIAQLLATVDELQGSDSASQLQAKRAERELREERDKNLRLERELEGWKGLRMDRTEAGLRRSGTFRALSEYGSQRGRGGSVAGSEAGTTMMQKAVAQQRKVSGHGFL